MKARLPYRRLLRLLWPYVLLWMLAATAAVGYATFETRSARERALASGAVEAGDLARVLEAHVARGLEGFGRTLGVLKRLHEGGGRSTPLAAFQSALDAASGSDVERRIMRFDRDGRFIESTELPARHAGASVSDRAWFSLARDNPGGQVIIGQPVSGRFSGKMVVPLVQPLVNAEGAFDGVLVTALDPVRLVQLFREIRMGARSSVGLADPEGRVFVWSASANSLSDDTEQAGATHSTTTPVGEPRQLRELVEADSVVARARISGTDLVAFAAFSRAEILDEQRGYARTIVLFTLVTLLVLALPIALVARRALREVERRSRLEIGIELERQSARTDPLTHAANRREFDERLAQCHAELVRSGLPFVLALIDVDHFNRLNDTLGHTIGDRALQRIASTLTAGVRSTDLVARLGGDEFAVLLAGMDRAGMRRPFETMVATLDESFRTEHWPISLSVGVIVFESPLARARDACSLTDHLMYDVKAAGRNGVRFAYYRDERLEVEHLPQREAA
jgi:diguanylate cyclase (GGDEF)-like protein